MNQELELIKEEVCRVLFDLNNTQWHSVKLVFDFPPYINKGWTGSQFFYDSEGNKIRLGLFGDEKFNTYLCKFIVDVNRNGSYNRIIFSANRNLNAEVEIDIVYNQDIVDGFENNLPKSKRGKTIPWWNNPEETKGLE